ncbi:hypothetical protein E2C01_025351 [Portunus trituberculatus]|uniref:Uncharacterized protein n=1 Tax=Portunus trituberculatus TaxID=210409 RepID=A0A5B7EEY1_PORTR|nr:hypothetical protein [Portunus trituberculatus]
MQKNYPLIVLVSSRLRIEDCEKEQPLNYHSVPQSQGIFCGLRHCHIYTNTPCQRRPRCLYTWNARTLSRGWSVEMVKGGIIIAFTWIFPKSECASLQTSELQGAQCATVGLLDGGIGVALSINLLKELNASLVYTYCVSDVEIL